MSVKTPAWLAIALLALAPPAHAAATSRVVYTFTGGTDGSFPNQPITDTHGNIYGTTQTGGAEGTCGEVFKLTPAGQLTTLASFSGTNGCLSDSPLTLADNVLYGTTLHGGASNDGVVFSVNTNGTNFRLLHQFAGKDGAAPTGTLLIADGALYGITADGGPLGDGALYQLDRTGTLAVLHAFSVANHTGYNPEDIRFGRGATIVGATAFGGNCGAYHGCGTLFSFNRRTMTYTVTYDFTGRADGATPQIGAVDAKGNLFGITNAGGLHGATGTLFELVAGTTENTFTTLYTFGPAPGARPTTGPALLPTGQLLGGTQADVYRYDPATPAASAVLLSQPGSPEFSGPAALGPRATAYINTEPGGEPGQYGQIWSLGPAAP